jgi:hypothetical protein
MPLGLIVMLYQVAANEGVIADLMDEVMGPRGLLAAALIVVGILWRLRERERNAHEMTLRDRIAAVEKERDLALEGWREQTSASARQATAMEEDARDRNSRSRQSDRR